MPWPERQPSSKKLQGTPRQWSALLLHPFQQGQNKAFGPLQLQLLLLQQLLLLLVGLKIELQLFLDLLQHQLIELGFISRNLHLAREAADPLLQLLWVGTGTGCGNCWRPIHLE